MLVTIGLVVRNCEATVKDTIESIAHQDFPHELIEVVIIDDGCKDRTVPIAIDGLSRTKMSFKVFQTGGSGLGEARQIAVDNAKGKYVLWVDGDLTLARDHTRKQIEFMESHPDVGKARGKWMLPERTSLVSSIESMRLLDYESKHTDNKFRGSQLVGIGGSICRLEAIRQAGGFDPKIKGAGEDVDIAAKMLKSGWSLRFSEAKFYHKFEQTWKDLWQQYFWYGYGAHYVNHKHKGLLSVWARTPPAAFCSGLLQSFAAYRFTQCKASFLLPFQKAFKQTAWCLGFIKGHLRNYTDSSAN